MIAATLRDNESTVCFFLFLHSSFSTKPHLGRLLLARFVCRGVIIMIIMIHALINRICDSSSCWSTRGNGNNHLYAGQDGVSPAERDCQSDLDASDNFSTGTQSQNYRASFSRANYPAQILKCIQEGLTRWAKLRRQASECAW